MSKSTKTFSIRLDSEFIEEFTNACNSLPIVFKPQSVVKGYMQSIIDLNNKIIASSSEIKELGYIPATEGFTLIDLSCKINKIQVSEDLFNVKE